MAQELSRKALYIERGIYQPGSLFSLGIRVSLKCLAAFFAFFTSNYDHESRQLAKQLSRVYIVLYFSLAISLLLTCKLCVLVYSLVVKLDSLEVLGFHYAAAAIRVPEVPQSDDPVCPSGQDDWVVIKHARCEPSHTLLLVRLYSMGKVQQVLKNTDITEEHLSKDTPE